MNSIILDLIIIFSGIIGYFISIALVTISFYKNRANNYLSVSLFLLTSLTLLSRYNIGDTVFEFLNNPVLEYLFPVTLFTYFLIQINHNYLKKNWYKYFYFPFILVVIIETIVYLNSTFDYYNPDINDVVFHITDNASFVYNVLLIFWGRKLIKNANKVSKDKKRWLLRLNHFIIVIIIFWLLSSIEFYIFDSVYASNLLWVGLSFLFWWILYYGVFKLQLIVQKEEIHDYLILNRLNKNIQPKHKIDRNKASKIITQLYELMDIEALFKNPLLSRSDIATRLDISEGHLSKIINQELNKSVTQFVNDYRIETAKILLHNPVFSKYSVEAIGMESGFKSKSAFYKSFKTDTEMSPGAYRKLQKTS